jgi:hypothetical protein
MIRTSSVSLLALSFVGCSWFASSAPRPLSKPTKDPPPPYGAVAPATPVPHPVGNQSPLEIGSAVPAPPSGPSEPPLIPPKASPVVPAGGFLPPAPKDVAPTVAVPSPEARNLADLKALVATAGAAWAAIDTYETVQTRRELNPKGVLNSETVFIQLRREPFAVFVRTTAGNGKGREMIYNPAQFGDKLHVMLGEGDHKLMPAGYVAPPISPDDPKVKEKARYSIRESGFCRPIGALRGAVAKLEAGKIPPDSLRFAGTVARPELPFPVVGVTHKLRPGDDPLMPLGGTRLYFFDMRKDSPAFAMPVLVTATDPTEVEVEYYLFEKVKQPANLTDTHFDPARLGKK